MPNNHDKLLKLLKDIADSSDLYDIREIEDELPDWHDADPPLEEKEESTLELAEEGLFELFGGEDGRVGAEMCWFRDPKHTEKDQVLFDRFLSKAGVMIDYFSIEEIDHLDFFIELLLDEEFTDGGVHIRGPSKDYWWWYDSIEVMMDRSQARLDELGKEEDRELEDDKLMKEAMKRRSTHE